MINVVSEQAVFL